MEESIIEQAADWVTRQQSGNMSDEDQASFSSWLDADSEHQRVYERMAAVLDRSAVLREVEVEAEVVPLRRAWSGRTWLVSAMAASIAVISVVFVLSLPDVSVETAVGERRSVPLSDGSLLHLNAMSEIEVTMDSSTRRIRMLRGEALFEVASDPSRPFIVNTGPVQVEVLGTTFEVSAYGDRRAVAVVEGRVAVRDEHRNAELGQGQQIGFANGSLGETVPVDVQQVAAWRDGWLYHERQPLHALVDRLNRHYHGHIEIVDPDLAGTDVNVVLRLEDREATLDRLQQLLPVVIEEAPGERVYIRPRD